LGSIFAATHTSSNPVEAWREHGLPQARVGFLPQAVITRAFHTWPTDLTVGLADQHLGRRGTTQGNGIYCQPT